MLKGSKNRLKSWVRFGTAAFTPDPTGRPLQQVRWEEARVWFNLSRATLPSPRHVTACRCCVFQCGVLPGAGQGEAAAVLFLKGPEGRRRLLPAGRKMVSCLWGGRGLAEGRVSPPDFPRLPEPVSGGHRPGCVGGRFRPGCWRVPTVGALSSARRRCRLAQEQQHPAGPRLDPPSGPGDWGAASRDGSCSLNPSGWRATAPYIENRRGQESGPTGGLPQTLASCQGSGQAWGVGGRRVLPPGRSWREGSNSDSVFSASRLSLCLLLLPACSMDFCLSLLGTLTHCFRALDLSVTVKSLVFRGLGPLVWLHASKIVEN